MKVQDRLVLSMWWPHYVDILHKDGHSFWTHSDRMWKCSRKYYVLMVILPTSLLGFVPAVHTAILMVVYGLRCLQGQVVSESEAEQLGVEPGSRVIDKASIPYYGFILLLGLVLLEGSCPVASLNPIMHHLVHYGSQTVRAGILGWLAMWSFERNNKKNKEIGEKCQIYSGFARQKRANGHCNQVRQPRQSVSKRRLETQMYMLPVPTK